MPHTQRFVPSSGQRDKCCRLEAGDEVDVLISALQRARGIDIDARTSPLEGLRFIDSRCAGDVWAPTQLWRSLDLDAPGWRVASLARGTRCAGVLARDGVQPAVWSRQQARRVAVVGDGGAAGGLGFADGLPQHQHLLRAMDVIGQVALRMVDRAHCHVGQPGLGARPARAAPRSLPVPGSPWVMAKPPSRICACSWLAMA